MKKTLLTYGGLLVFFGTSLLSTPTWAAACVSGTAPAAGCTISTDNTDYTLTGDIDPGSAVDGIGFTDGSDGNGLDLTGNITTTGTNAYGIYLFESDSNTITYTGNITTTGNSARGIFLHTNNDSNTITITGNISTTGNSARGIHLYRGSDSNTITMTGNISTTGTNGRGIYLDDNSNSNTITYTGNITTTGNTGHGISMITSDSNTITYTGNITTAGTNANGFNLYNSNDSNTITYTGNITTTGTNGRGIYLHNNNDFNTITMTGNITTAGTDGNGIKLATSDSNTLTINGDIITSGAAESVLLNDSDSNTITLSGAVHSLAGDQAISVNASSQSNAFTFKRGVSFIGGLENNGGSTNTLRFDMGKAASYNLDFNSTSWTVEDTSKPIISGSGFAKSMGVADIDNQAHILYRRMNPINDVLSERQRLYADNQQPQGYWIDSYYGHGKRDKEFSEISGNAGGLTVGYVLENTQTPMEVLVNFEVSKDKYGVGSEQTTESNSLIAGLFLPVLSQDVMGGDLSAKVLVGLSDNNSDRKVLNNSLGLTRSSEIVSGDYKSAYVSVGTEWLTQFFKRERAMHAFSVGVDVVQAYVEDYSAGEYKVDDRNVTQLQVRAQYGVDYQTLGKKLSIGGRLGIAYQELLSGDKQDYKINGTSTSYKGDDSNAYYNAGLGAKYYLADATNLYVDTKVGRSSDAISNITVDFGFISHF